MLKLLLTFLKSKADIINIKKKASIIFSLLLKDKLVRKYRITGVPTLVLIDCSKLSLITRDGRYYVLNDRDGDGFPWQPETLDLCLTEGYLEDREGVDVAWNDIKDSVKILGLFFSAHWVRNRIDNVSNVLIQ